MPPNRPAADGDKTLSEAISQSYEGLLEPWKEVDGLEMRTIGNPSTALADHNRGKTLEQAVHEFPRPSPA